MTKKKYGSEISETPGKKMCIYDITTANDISYLLKNAGTLIANLKSLRSNEDER